MKTLITLLSLVVLNSCGHGDGFSSAERIISHGWARVANEDIKKAKPIYCYKTIGKIDCYKQPLPGKGHLLVTDYPPKMPQQ